MSIHICAVYIPTQRRSERDEQSHYVNLDQIMDPSDRPKTITKKLTMTTLTIRFGFDVRFGAFKFLYIRNKLDCIKNITLS